MQFLMTLSVLFNAATGRASQSVSAADAALPAVVKRGTMTRIYDSLKKAELERQARTEISPLLPIDQVVSASVLTPEPCRRAHASSNEAG